MNKSKKLKFPIYKQKCNPAVKDDCRRSLIQGLNHLRIKFFLSLQGVSFFFTKMKEMPFKNKLPFPRKNNYSTAPKEKLAVLIKEKNFFGNLSLCKHSLAYRKIDDLIIWQVIKFDKFRRGI